MQADLVQVDLAQVDRAQVDLAQVEPAQVDLLPASGPALLGPLAELGRRHKPLCRVPIHV